MTQFALTSPNIDPGGPNAGFIRPKAALAIIVVTNEDDHSFGTTDYYARVFSGAQGQGQREPRHLLGHRRARPPTAARRRAKTSLYGSLAEPGVPLRRGRRQDRRRHRQHLRRELRADADAHRPGAQHPQARLPAHPQAASPARVQVTVDRGERPPSPSRPRQRLPVPGRHQQRRLPRHLRPPPGSTVASSTPSRRDDRAPRHAAPRFAPARRRRRRGCSRTALNADCPNGYSHQRRRHVRLLDRRGLPHRLPLRRRRLRLPRYGLLPRRVRVLHRLRAVRLPRLGLLPARITAGSRAEGAAPAAPRTAAPTATSSIRRRSAASAMATPAARRASLGRRSSRLCACASDDCCPVDYRFDPVTKDCACAKTECCPPNHVYDAGLRPPASASATPAARPASARAPTTAASASTTRRARPARSATRRRAAAGAEQRGLPERTTSATRWASASRSRRAPRTSTARRHLLRHHDHQCVPDGPCTLDEHCAMRKVCSTATLACQRRLPRRRRLRPTKNSLRQRPVPVLLPQQQLLPGQPVLRHHQAAPAPPRSSRVDCAMLQLAARLRQRAVARCLAFVTEGHEPPSAGRSASRRRLPVGLRLRRGDLQLQRWRLLRPRQRRDASPASVPGRERGGRLSSSAPTPLASRTSTSRRARLLPAGVRPRRLRSWCDRFAGEAAGSGTGC